MVAQVIQLQEFGPAIADLDLPRVTVSLRPGTVTCFLGASGCGKTSMLRAMHGELPSSGDMTQGVGSFMVYQSLDQLFPWMTMRANIQLVSSDAQELEDLARRWGVGDLLDRTPLQCSGGQRQRFALIRALLSGRQLILCDEPLSGVDAFTAENIAKDVVTEVHRRDLQVVWVTHNWHEAGILGDQTVVFRAGAASVWGRLDEREAYAAIVE